MNLFSHLVKWFADEEIEYALIGGVAVHCYGYSRATRDVDFAVRSENQDEIVAHLETLGFETLYRSSGFSNHLHSVGSVRVDFLYANGSTGDELFSQTRSMTSTGVADVRVASPEHIVAMKVFACRNDPTRKLKELADIRELVIRQKLDRMLVRGYFEKYGQLELWELLDLADSDD